MEYLICPKNTQNRFKLTLPLKKLTPDVTPEVTPEDKLIKISPEMKKMIKVIKVNMTRKEIMDLLRLKDEKHFRKHYLQNAIAEKPRSKNQKYRLTDKGHKILKRLKEHSEVSEKRGMI